jgi:hypothetical protein
MATFFDLLGQFDAAVAERHPHLSQLERVRYVGLVLNELTAVIGRGGEPAAVLLGGRTVALTVDFLLNENPAPRSRRSPS